MGVHNRISENKYNAMKRATKSPADDANTMRAFGVGASTVRNVRNTANYQEYCERVFRYHGHPNKARTIKTPAIMVANDLDKASLSQRFPEPKPSMLGLVLLFFFVMLLSAFTVGLVWFAVNFLGSAK